MDGRRRGDADGVRYPTVLVNNAGFEPNGSIDSQSVDEFTRAMDVNLLGTWFGIRAVLPGMRRAGSGSTVNVSPAAAFSGSYVAPGMAAYTASKWAVRGLTKAAALEMGRDGIRVNSVHPGVIDIPMFTSADMDDPRVWVGHAIKRAGRPSEVAELTVYLAGSRSSYSTGGEFVVDRGMTAGRAR